MQMAISAARRRLRFLRDTPVGWVWRTCLAIWRTARELDPRTVRNRIGAWRTHNRLRAIVDAAPAEFTGTLLIDGTWFNPNYFVRLTLLRAALGSRTAKEIVVVREDLADLQRRAFRSLGFNHFIVCPWRQPSDESKARARAALAGVRNPADFLAKVFAPGVLTDVVIYDGILKIVRSAEVDVGSEETVTLLARFFEVNDFVGRTLEDVRPDLVVVTHVVHFFYGSLACRASNLGVPVVLAQGRHGMTKFVRIRKPADAYDFEDRPCLQDLETLTSARQAEFARAGERYLDRRFGGRTGDIGAIYAFQRRTAAITRNGIADRFGWDQSKPICGVYMSNWFDFPHACGMQNFTDFLDFARFTLDRAAAQPDRNWVFKAHPCDDWYGGLTLNDLVDVSDAPNVAIADKSWSGHDLLQALDMFVTAHGTVGIEAAALGKPVLCCDRGWYHDLGFVHYARTRAAYAESFHTDWWRAIDPDDARYRALVFAGMMFCRPTWQRHFILQDDAHVTDLYATLPGMLGRCADNELPIELDLLRSWIATDAPAFHTFKMKQNADALSI